MGGGQEILALEYRNRFQLADTAHVSYFFIAIIEEPQQLDILMPTNSLVSKC